MTPEQIDRIGEILKVKGADKPCPRCGQDQFEVVEFTNVPLSNPNNKTVLIPGYQIPVVLIACANCGYLYHHALYTLGLLDAAGNVKAWGGLES